MTEIESYLHKTHHILNYVTYGDEGAKNEQIRTLINVACERYNLKKIDIYSSSIYPHLAYDKNGRGYLIWDNHFWNMFDYYGNLAETTTLHKEPESWLRRAAMSLLFIINANLLDARPSLSKAFADMYATLVPMYGFYDGQFQNPACSDFVYDLSAHARLYVLYHEISHREFRKDPEALSIGKRYIKRFLDEFQDTDEMYRTFVFPTIKDVAERLEEVLNGDDVAIQEFMCDLKACKMLLDMMLLAYGNKVKNESKFVLMVAILVNIFTSYINRNLSEWYHIYDLWHKSPGTMEFIHAHNHDQLTNTDKDIKLRIKMLQIAFSRECERQYGRPVIINIKDEYFSAASEHIFEWGFVQEIITRERFYYNNYSPEQNLKDSQRILRWNQ